MLLTFDVTEGQVREHDQWHTYEHLPERLSIPGFLRGTRWTAVHGQPRYMVLYEVQSLDTLTSAAYLERLNNPSPWTTRMMSHYRGMSRGLCSVVASAGLGIGRFSLLMRFREAPGAEARIVAWLRADVLADLPTRPGLGSVHLLRSAAKPPMTNEQRIRGEDTGVDAALIFTAYDEAALNGISDTFLGSSGLEQRGAVNVTACKYEIHYSLSRTEIDA